MKRQRVLAGLLAGMLVFSNCAPTWAAEDMLVDDSIDSSVLAAQEEEEQEGSYTEEANSMDTAEGVDDEVNAGADTDYDATDAQQTNEDTADEEGSEETTPDLTNADADPASEEGNNAEDVDPVDENLGEDVFVDEAADDVEAASDIPDAEFGMIEGDEGIDDNDGLLMASGIEEGEEDDTILTASGSDLGDNTVQVTFDANGGMFKTEDGYESVQYDYWEIGSYISMDWWMQPDPGEEMEGKVFAGYAGRRLHPVRGVEGRPGGRVRRERRSVL